MRMTAIQAERTRKIAAHAGHFWAVTPETIGLCDTDEIKAASEQAARQATFSSDVKDLTHGPTVAMENVLVYDTRKAFSVTCGIGRDGHVEIAAFDDTDEQVAISVDLAFDAHGRGLTRANHTTGAPYGAAQIEAIQGVMRLFCDEEMTKGVTVMFDGYASYFRKRAEAEVKRYANVKEVDRVMQAQFGKKADR